MKHWIALAAAASAAACVGGPSMFGAGPGGRTQQSMVLTADSLLWVSFDADHDYRTTRAEAEAGVAREWENAGGGASLSPIQFQAWARRAMGGSDLPPFSYEFDANVNNQVTREEFTSALMDRFAARDVNHDDALMRADFIEDLQLPMRPQGGGERPRMRPPG